jgi:sporulation protein YlmC with PRC-barrel domain
MIPVSRIIDQDVYDGTGKLIGEVDDIIIRRGGKVKKMTVEFGGLLDIGDKLVSLPFKGFSMKNGNVTLDETEQELEKRPEFNYYRQGLRPGYYYRTTPYAYRYPPPGYYYSPGNQDQPGRPHPLIGLFEWAFSPPRFLASVVMNRLLVNEEGKELGRIKDLLVSRKDNKVEKIIVSSIPHLEEDVHVALLYEPLGFTAYGLVYDISRRKLKDFIYAYEK